VRESRILEVAELDFRLGTSPWTFARERASDIEAHWSQRKAAQPSLFNGRVLLLGSHGFTTRTDGGVVLTGEYFETDFAAFLAWRDFGFPDEGVCNCFSMAALRAADGAFLLGEMGAHTATAGAIYFAAGTPDRQDVFGERVDLTASVKRELREETGLSAEDTRYENAWVVVHAPPRIACMKIMSLPMLAEAAKARIEAFLASETKPELARMHIARRAGDVDPTRAPAFIQDFLSYAFAQSSG
jgi:hypothetical protein